MLFLELYFYVYIFICNNKFYIFSFCFYINDFKKFCFYILFYIYFIFKVCVVEVGTCSNLFFNQCFKQSFLLSYNSFLRPSMLSGNKLLTVIIVTF